MNRIILSFFLLIIINYCYGQSSLPTGESTSSASTYQRILGDWSGDLDFSGMKLTLILHVGLNDAEEAIATLDSPDQGITGISVDKMTLDNETLKFEIHQLAASFEGNVDREKNQISGMFTQGAVSLPLILKTGIHLKKRPQEPSPPFPYKEEDVSYENTSANITLSGTLTFPKSPGPFPAVVLITGSGPHDRNETVFGHKPFLVLANHLTRCGIAVLRVDDRGVAQSTGVFETATSADFATDVASSVEYLKSRKEINNQQIGLIGHSEGGMIAPMVAAKSKDVSFIVLMAGTGVTGEEIIYEQQALLLRAEGVSEDVICENHEQQKKLFSVLKSELDMESAQKQLIDILTKLDANLSDQDQIESMANALNTKWLRFFITHDPAKVLQQITIPVLALIGELDVQVSPSQNLPVISEALKKAGNNDFEVVELPKLNHLFQTCKTGSTTEYTEIEETIAPIALKRISDWILQRTDSKKELVHAK